MTGDTMAWQLAVTFTEAPDGWVLTDVDVYPEAGSGVLDAIARVIRLLADGGTPVRGACWGGTP